MWVQDTPLCVSSVHLLHGSRSDPTTLLQTFTRGDKKIENGKDIKVASILYNEHISTGLDQSVAQMHNWITVDYLHKVYVTIEHVFSLDNVYK